MIPPNLQQKIRTAQPVCSTFALDAQPGGYGATRAETGLGRPTKSPSLVGRGASQGQKHAPVSLRRQPEPARQPGFATRSWHGSIWTHCWARSSDPTRKKRKIGNFSFFLCCSVEPWAPVAAGWEGAQGESPSHRFRGFGVYQGQATPRAASSKLGLGSAAQKWVTAPRRPCQGSPGLVHLCPCPRSFCGSSACTYHGQDTRCWGQGAGRGS